MSDTTVEDGNQKGKSTDAEEREDELHSDNERYKIGKTLGEGGMGVVKLAQDKSLERKVALKYLRAKLVSNQVSYDRFLDEAKIMGNLDHPGAVPVYELGTFPDGRPFYSMKKVSGQTLRDLLADRKRSDIKNHHSLLHLVDLFQRVCETIAYAHSKKVIHRDLKPDNVMVDKHGAVFVVDWGIAKRMTPQGKSLDKLQTKAGIVLGSPGYMAPEQAEGKTHKTNYSTDVFSLGVILYEILSGEHPFQGDSVTQLIDDVIYHVPDTPRRVNSSIPRDLAAICVKALEKDPRKRYPTAKELLDDVRCFREHRAISAAKPRIIDHLKNWTRRKPALASTLVTLLLVVTIVSSSLIYRHYQETQFLHMIFGLLEDSRREVEELTIEIAKLRTNLERTGEAPGTRQEQRKILHDLESLREVKEQNVTAYLSAIIGSTYDYPNPRALREARESRKEMIERYFQEEKYSQAKYFITQILQRVQRKNLLQYTDTDIKHFQSQLEKAEKLSAAQQH